MGVEVLNGFHDPSGPFWAISGQNCALNDDFAAGTSKSLPTNDFFNFFTPIDKAPQDRRGGAQWFS